MPQELADKVTHDLDKLSWHLDMLFITCILALGLIAVLLLRSWRAKP